MAAVEKLPLVVVVADNQFAYSTPRERQFACDSLLERAAGYGVDCCEIDGTNLQECMDAMQKCVSNARAGNGPQVIIARLLRLCGHGEHDDAAYVPSGVRNSVLGRDCLDFAQQQLIDAGLVSGSQIESWKNEAAEQVQEAVAIAQKEHGPDPYQEDWRATSTPGMY